MVGDLGDGRALNSQQFGNWSMRLQPGSVSYGRVSLIVTTPKGWNFSSAFDPYSEGAMGADSSRGKTRLGIEPTTYLAQPDLDLKDALVKSLCSSEKRPDSLGWRWSCAVEGTQRTWSWKTLMFFLAEGTFFCIYNNKCSSIHWPLLQMLQVKL